MADPTYIACLTPPGKAAVASLAVRGPLAAGATRALFRPRHGTLPAELQAGQRWLGQIGGDVGDTVVLAVKQGSPNVSLEIHCHGGPAVVRLIEERYARHGIAACSWQELQRHISGPAWQVAAQEWLVQASTARTAAILLDQYAGAFDRAMEGIRTTPSDVARAKLERLARLVPLGRHLLQPWSVVIAGAPNVGKSSLVNALAGYTRSLVAPTAGTTRDVVSTILAIDGWPVELSDTAGLRLAEGGIEQEGVTRAHDAAARADLRIWVFDGATEPAFPAESGLAWQMAINKCDLPPAWDWQSVPEALRVSARTGAGLTELCAAISAWLAPEPPAAGEAVPFNPETCDEVLRALGAW
jgi:tRNA modification GTPase